MRRLNLFLFEAEAADSEVAVHCFELGAQRAWAWLCFGITIKNLLNWCGM